ncbi:phage scaffolding protein [Halocella sp. SP3-1]|uniref:phage scaffolding protein n=1 Tax=Halocella sp. SP3-1 TaxID=2382161 RepID=UPI000F75C97D|nr:phage scaffolding protein [Halocella sp. SP3-1]AZO96140.1 hypothetical protein D7D81_16940 [Halocella sp. SP3-1]
MDLKELLGEELFAQVNEKLEAQEGDIKLLVNDGSFIPRSRLNDKTSELESLQEQLKAKDELIAENKKQMEQLKNDTQASEELKAKIAEYEEQNKTLQEQTKQQIEQKQQELIRTKKQAALQVALKDTKYPDLLLKNVDYEQIGVDDKGNLTGLDDVVTGLKESYADLFGKTTIKGKEPNPTKDNVPGKHFTMEGIQGMSAKEINDNWDEVQKVLENN